MAKSFFIDAIKNIVKWDKKLEIYTNGEDNQYSERMELLLNNSVTGVMASNLMMQYLIGNGFGDADNFKINGVKLIELARKIAKDIVVNKGYFLHVTYDANFKVAGYKHIPFNKCRIGKVDSQDYNGKILISNNWLDITKNKAIPFDVFNKKEDVVKSQMGIKKSDKEADIVNKVRKYKGQILYFNFDEEYHYPLARINSVSMDCRSEYLASVYKNEILERGFFGKTLIVTRPLIDNNFILQARESNDPILLKSLREKESEVASFNNNIKQFMGVVGSGGAMHVEMDFKGEKLEDSILIKNIESNIDDKLFEFTERSVTEKILMTFNNLPIDLVKSSSTIFGANGSTLIEMKKGYWENTSYERNHLQDLINDILRNVDGIVHTQEYTILPLVKAEIISDDTALIEKQKAQSNLKGSVGGVTALLEIIRAVNSGETQYDSAVNIIEEIYGVSQEKAVLLIGVRK